MDADGVDHTRMALGERVERGRILEIGADRNEVLDAGFVRLADEIVGRFRREIVA
jgi:hypothetical protein